MTLYEARRLSDILMALAFVQQGLEHLAGARAERPWFALQVGLAFGVAGGVAPVAFESALLFASLGVLRRFNGPYNGGSDRMRLLVLCCLWASHVSVNPTWQRMALGYLAVQVTLSYAIAGGVKLANADWRTGRALTDVFAFSAYPVSERLRRWADRPRAMRTLSWLVMLFEVLFPVSFASAATLQVALFVALIFHVGNAAVFGLNRFVWIWVAAYPCLLWFQQEIIRSAF